MLGTPTAAKASDPLQQTQQSWQDLSGEAGVSVGAVPASPWQITLKSAACAVAISTVAHAPASVCTSNAAIAKNATARLWCMVVRYGKMTFRIQRYHTRRAP
jgi:hypothetical protein